MKLIKVLHLDYKTNLTDLLFQREDRSVEIVRIPTIFARRLYDKKLGKEIPDEEIDNLYQKFAPLQETIGMYAEVSVPQYVVINGNEELKSIRKLVLL